MTSASVHALRKLMIVTGAAVGLSGLAGTAAAGEPAAAPAALPPLAVPNPVYTVVSYEVDVNRPAAATWARVGKFCGIRDWRPKTVCRIISGDENQLGAVRMLENGLIEPMVGMTDLSYTYALPVRVGVPYNLQHGTLQAKPLTATTSRLIYSVMYDSSDLSKEVAAKTIEDRRKRLTSYLQNMKILAEGGTLPPGTL